MQKEESGTQNKPNVTETTDQVIRFHLPVEFIDWTPENGARCIRESIGTFPDPQLNALIEEKIDELDPDAQKDLLQHMAQVSALNSILPFFTQASEQLGLEMSGDLSSEAPLDAFVVSTSLVDQLCQQGEASVRDGVLQIEDCVLAVFSRSPISKLWNGDALFNALSAAQNHSCGVGWFTIYCIESFRHAFRWSELSMVERAALTDPCHAAVQTLFGESGVEAMGDRIPWLFAFPLWYTRHGQEPPGWIHQWDSRGGFG